MLVITLKDSPTTSDWVARQKMGHMLFHMLFATTTVNGSLTWCWPYDNSKVTTLGISPSRCVRFIVTRMLPFIGTRSHLAVRPTFHPRSSVHKVPSARLPQKFSVQGTWSSRDVKEHPASPLSPLGVGQDQSWAKQQGTFRAR